MRDTKSKSKFFRHGIIASVSAGLIGFGYRAYAQGVSLGFPSSFAGFSSQDLKTTIENVVMIILGFIGIVFVIILIAAGIIWMTSGGNQDKINRAKKMIAAAVIGLLITLSAYSIARFIVQSLQQAITPAPPGLSVCGADGDGDGALWDPGETCDQGFGVNGTAPGTCNAICTGFIPLPGGCTDPGPGPDTLYGTDDDPVKVCPGGVTNPANLNQAITIYGWNFGTYGDLSEVTLNGTVAPPAICSGSPSWGPTQIVVIVDGNTPLGISPDNVVVTRDNDPATPGGTSETCIPGLPTNCGSTDVQNGTSPFITCMAPNFGPNGFGPVVVEGGNFATQPPNSYFMQGAFGPFDVTNNPANISFWDDTEINFSVPAGAVPEPAITGPVFVAEPGADTVLGTGDDIKSNTLNFIVTCTTPSNASAECATGCCTNALQCQPMAYCSNIAGPNDPVITLISPDNGEEGSYVTIQGYNFESYLAGSSELSFIWAPGTPGEITYTNPFPAVCSVNWTDTQIIMEIPAIPPATSPPPPELPNGPAQVIVKNKSGLSSQPEFFTVNDVIRPGLCSVTPSSGVYMDTFALKGNLLALGQDIFFGNPNAPISADNQSITPIQDAQGDVPNLAPAATTVAMADKGVDGIFGDPDGSGPLVSDDIFSNPLAFSVGAIGTDPRVTDLDPHDGPKKTYVTVYGANFGSIPGAVYFVKYVPPPGTQPPPGSPLEEKFLADTNFPAACASDFWNDIQIIVKVPDNPLLFNDDYFVRVEPAAGGVSQEIYISGVNDFAVNANPLNPGLCKINPTGGPAGTRVNYWGQFLGSVTGNIYFETSTPSLSILGWSDTYLAGAKVPPDAQSGPTHASSSTGIPSNSLLYTVGSCTSTAQCLVGNCCGDGTCRTQCAPTPLYDEEKWVFTTMNDPFNLNRQIFCTEDIQSPTPFPYEQYQDLPFNPSKPLPAKAYDPNDPETVAPVNSIIAGTFNRPVNFSTIPGSIHIYKCAFDGSPFIGWALSGGSASCITNVTSDGMFKPVGSNGWLWEPNSGSYEFDYSTWYEVRLDVDDAVPTVDSTIFAQDGSKYEGSRFLGTQGTIESYRWHFKTRDGSQDLCEVSAVTLSPSSVVIPVGGESPVTAIPTSPFCYICGGAYDYEWSCAPDPTPPDPVYTKFAPGTGLAGPDGTYCTPDDDDAVTNRTIKFKGFNITRDRDVPPGAPSTFMNATLLNGPGGLPISTTPLTHQLSVANLAPIVIDAQPNNSCGAICSNAIASATFNMSLLPEPAQRLDPDGFCVTGDEKVHVLEMSGPGCGGFGADYCSTVQLSTRYQPDDWILITPGFGTFFVNTCYRVVLEETIVNMQGQQMDPNYLNYQYNGPFGPGSGVGTACTPGAGGNCDSFAWTFTPSLDPSACVPTAIDIAPSSELYTYASQVKNFTALPKVFDNQCGWQYLQGSIYNWAWSDPAALLSVSNLDKDTPPDGLTDEYQSATNLGLTVPGIPSFTQVQAKITTLVIPPGVSDIEIRDTRDRNELVGHRPDATTGRYSPPEILIPAPPVGCPLGSAGGTPAGCILACMNVGTSAIFSANLDENTVKTSIPPGYIAYYGFNDGTTKESVSGASGSIIGGVSVTNSNSSIRGLAADFDGDLTNQTHIDYGKDQRLNITGDVAISAWIYPVSLNDPVGNGNAIVRWEFEAPMGLRIRETGQIEFVLYLGTPPTGTWRNPVSPNTAGNVVVAGQWQHVVVTREGGVYRFYLDGRLVHTETEPVLPNPAPSGTFMMGAASNGDIQNWNGMIDEVYIYKKALQDTDVRNLFAVGSGKSKFYATNNVTGDIIPGSLSIQNYRESAGGGFCYAAPTQVCSTDVDCAGPPANGGRCSMNRGRISFTPNLGTISLANGLLAYYPFDDGTADDASGRWVKGILTDDAFVESSPASPLRGGALKLDGWGVCEDDGTACRTNSAPSANNCSTGICKPVDMMQIADPLQGTESGTISFWTRPDSFAPTTGWMVPVLQHTSGGWGDFYFNIGGSMFLHLYNNCGDTAPIPVTDFYRPGGLDRVVLNKWQHWVLTYEFDGNDTDLEYYLDGKFLKRQDNIFSSFGCASKKLRTGAGTLHIGDDNNLFLGFRDFYPFEGRFDELSFYDRALNAVEVFALYSSGLKSGLFTSVVPPGIYPANTQIQLNVCQNGSCDIASGGSPIVSTSGVPYSTPETFGFTSGANICLISYVEITPDPAVFDDIRDECAVTVPLCTTGGLVAQIITAQAIDATGLELPAVDYVWRKTTEFLGPYASNYYALNQFTGFPDSAVVHKGLLGTDYNFVTATNQLVPTNIVSASGRMDFFFCENPWIGQITPDEIYYLDPTYDFRLAYCRDAKGSNPSDPAGLLPNLPAPHIVRSVNPLTPFTASSDLLKEHVFVVDTSITGGIPISSNDPSYTITQGALNAQISPVYNVGDLVYFKLEAADPQGDSFVYVMNEEPFGQDRLPATANFNIRTGVFTWVVDAVPKDDDDGDLLCGGGTVACKDFDLVFGLPAPATDTRRVTINVNPNLTSSTIVKPTMTSFAIPVLGISSGGTVTIPYGTTVDFTAQRGSLGSIADAQGVVTAATAIKSFVWDFQDSGATTYGGSADPIYDATHTFIQSGPHQVTFRVMNDLGVWSNPSVINVIVQPK